VNERAPTQPTTAQSGDDDMFRRLVDSVTDYAIFMLTPDGHIASWNPGAERLKGYRADEAIGQHFSIFYPQEAIDRGWPAEELKRASADGRIEDLGWRLRKDGSRFWANVVISAIRDDAGTLLGFSKVTRDLTERKAHEERLAQSERKLRESERTLRLLVDGVQDYAIFRLDPDGIVSSWNKGAQRIKGYAPDEIIGKHFSVFYPPEVAARGWPEQELTYATERGHFEDEGWRVRKDGTLFWANVVITAIRDDDGTLLGFSKVTRDLTERRGHEQALRESEENLRLVVDGVRDHAMFLVAPDGSIRTWNTGAERLLGFKPEAVVGQPLSILYLDEDKASGRPQAELRSARHAGFYESEGWRRKLGGERIWSHSALTALVDHDGRVRAYVQIIRDLADRMRVQALEDEGKRIQHFIAMLSHELRNPIAPIVNVAAILKRKYRDQEVAWCADLIERQASQLSRLVNDLLDLSRITAGKIQLQPQVLELNTLVRVACDMALPQVEAAGHALTVRPAPQSVFVRADATRLTQVISNLLSNAVKYTPSGGRIEVAVERDRSFAAIQVTDTGIGMTDALMQRVFDPFVQGDRGPERSGGGLGIGLSLVKELVELHGGTVAVASAGPDQGTRFTVTLPLSATMPAPVPTGEAAAMEQCSGRVLVVDDNKDAAASLAELLRLLGLEVVAANDGVSALEALDEQRPDLALLDIGMPGMDGFELARRIHAMPGCDDLPLVALTGYGQDSDRKATAAAGFAAHLVKPVAADALQRALHALLQPETGDTRKRGSTT
jgi:hypothetical protein